MHLGFQGEFRGTLLNGAPRMVDLRLIRSVCNVGTLDHGSSSYHREPNQECGSRHENEGTPDRRNTGRRQDPTIGAAVSSFDVLHLRISHFHHFVFHVFILMFIVDSPRWNPGKDVATDSIRAYEKQTLSLPRLIAGEIAPVHSNRRIRAMPASLPIALFFSRLFP